MKKENLSCMSALINEELTISEELFNAVDNIDGLSIKEKSFLTDENIGTMLFLYDGLEFKVSFSFEECPSGYFKDIHRQYCTEKEYEEIDNARFLFNLSMKFAGNPQKSYHLQLKLIHAIMPEMIALYDQGAFMLLNRKWVELAVKSNLVPSIESLYNVHAVNDGDQVWLHTHGLSRCNLYEVEILDSNVSDYNTHYSLLSCYAGMLVSEYIKSVDQKGSMHDDVKGFDDEVFNIGTFSDGEPILAFSIPWKEAMMYYPKNILGALEDRKNDHMTDSNVIFLYETEEDMLNNRPRKIGEFTDRLNDNPMFFVSDMETARMSALAKERFCYVEKIVKEKSANAENIGILVKLGLPTLNEDGTLDYENREHIWFELLSFEGEKFKARLIQEPYYIPDMHEGDEGVYSVSDVSDWKIYIDDKMITPEMVYCLDIKVKKEKEDMDILNKCQNWHETNEHEKIVDALESIPCNERTKEIDMELARAYNNLGTSDRQASRKLLKKALELMQSHQNELLETYSWNFRMGYTFYCLDQEGIALKYFEKALELHPGDDPKLNTKADIEEFIDSCHKCIALPYFEKSFRERTEKGWEAFAKVEAELRKIIDEDKENTRSEEIVAKVEEILNLVFDEISFEIGVNCEKYELILTPEGNKVKLFEIDYFQKHAPKEVLEHWNIIVGRQPFENIGIRTDDGWDISDDDIKIWIDEQNENSATISAFCEKLLPMLQEDVNRAWWIIVSLIDQVLGEIPNMRYIDNLDVLKAPKEGSSINLSKLPDKLKENGMEISTNLEEYMDIYLGYKMDPNDNPDADWRLDIVSGVTNCEPIVNSYFAANNWYMDELHADGIVAGFFCYPLDTLKEEEGSQKIFDFRDKIEEFFTAGNGVEYLTIIGGATGLFYGYIDFIAWDIRETLNRAKEFFEGTDIPWAGFHTFRREAGTVGLKKSPEITG